MTFSEKIKKWQNEILTASIILNVFLIGFMVARLAGPQPVPPQPRQAHFEMRTLPEGLSREAREQIEEQMRHHQEVVNAAYERLQEVQEEINVMVSEQDFDAQKLERALSEMRHLEGRIRGPLQRAFVNVMRQMDTESRRAIARERREEIRARAPRSTRQPDRVDGSRWSFSSDDGHFELKIDELEDLKMLEGLRGLRELEHLAPLSGIESLGNLEELSDLENFEIIITRDKDDNNNEKVRFVVIDRDKDKVIEKEVVVEGDDN